MCVNAVVIQAVAVIIQAGAAVVLVWVTMKYAQATSKILEENRKNREEMEKSRRVDLLKERLGYLYYPLKYNERHLTSPTWINSQFTEDFIKFYQYIPRYSYLAGEELFRLLPPFFILINEIIKETARNFDEKYRKQLSEMGNEIIRQVGEDCSEYEKELHELTGE